MNYISPNYRDVPVVSRHQFTKQRIKVLLPLSMLGTVFACGLTIPPHVRPIEVVVFSLLAFIAISAYVPVCEIDVLDSGLIVRRILFPTKQIPWSSIDRVLIFRHCNSAGTTILELTSIGLYEGLSPLNRLPGLLYGQGLRQTIVITPDSVKGYDQLVSTLSAHCAVFRSPIAGQFSD